jgi:UDP-glucose:(heptosyl)LPS alpha-1,3-glucosyltransferase
MQCIDPGIVVGFNKMPGLDVYYAADVCFATKVFDERNFFYRHTPRARHHLAMENAVFGRASHTEVLMMISKAQIDVYQRHYQTPSQRLHLLPPGIRRERVLPENYAALRPQWRAEYQLDAATLLALFVGSDYRRKGLDRALRGIAELEEPLRQRVQLWVVGQDKETPFVNLIRTLNIERQVRFLGARDDVSQLLWAADLLMHPAYSENTGTVLLEGMVAGLPVIASQVCGYANYIVENQMGRVLADPITPPLVADAITAVFAEPGAMWRERARNFAARADIFSMPERAAEFIENCPAARRNTA